ncbi:MAG TPA: hypothetical protein DEQ32_17245 [Gammaproteobacteria bacterium]|nr:hypothetical protein [Gammaproteobacteria bacterium]
MFLTGGCTNMEKPLATVDHVDLPRFMGDWFVIAGIPTFVERNALAPIENYTLESDGTVSTLFSYQKSNSPSSAGQLSSTGFIDDPSSNAVWGMQFIWPIKADYRIFYLNNDYSITMIGRNKRDYLWIMARHYPLPESQLAELIKRAEEVGYDISKIQLYSWQQEADISPRSASNAP